MIIAPSIRFSSWTPWIRRQDLRRTCPASAGVYLWARFSELPDNRLLPYPEIPAELIYVGETKNLHERPLSGAHHRLAHYADCFPEDGEKRCLYISVFPVAQFEATDPRCVRAFTRYVEDLIYWEYARRYEKRAALDYKKGKDKP